MVAVRTGTATSLPPIVIAATNPVAMSSNASTGALAWYASSGCSNAATFAVARLLTR